MKKYFLGISLAFCFCLAFAGTGNVHVNKPAVSSAVEGNLYSILSLTYPHTECDVTSHTVSVNSSCRQQNLQTFLSAAEFSHRCIHNIIIESSEYTSNISFSQYLFHIYPSHNFW